MKISEIKSNEGGRHFMAKKLLFEWIGDDRGVCFELNDGRYLEISESSWNFLSMESYAFSNKRSEWDKYISEITPKEIAEWKEIEGEYYEEPSFSEDAFRPPFYSNVWCDKVQAQEVEYIEDDKGNPIDMLDIDNRIFDIGELNKNTFIYDMDGFYNKEAYYSHPCNFCSFNDKCKTSFIFDIGLARKGMYELAIEIVDTAPVKKNKIEFCRRNDITLISLNYRDVLGSKLSPRHYKADLLFEGERSHIRKSLAEKPIIHF